MESMSDSSSSSSKTPPGAPPNSVDTDRASDSVSRYGNTFAVVHFGPDAPLLPAVEAENSSPAAGAPPADIKSVGGVREANDWEDEVLRSLTEAFARAERLAEDDSQKDDSQTPSQHLVNRMQKWRSQIPGLDRLLLNYQVMDMKNLVTLRRQVRLLHERLGAVDDNVKTFNINQLHRDRDNMERRYSRNVATTEHKVKDPDCELGPT